MNTFTDSVTLLTQGTILTMDAEHQTFSEGAIAISNDRIHAIGNTADLLIQYPQAVIHPCPDTIIIPGLLNAHSHIPMSYFKGLADDLPLDKWLQGYIWPLEGKLLSPQFVYDASLHGAAEMLRAGITLTSDMYFFGDDIARALSKAGLRGMLGEAIVDFRLPSSASRETIGNFAIEQNQKYQDNDLIDFVLSPHSIYACSRYTLQKVQQKAQQHGLLIHTHLSETANEVLDCLQAHSMRPVHYLHSLGLLDSPLVLAHGVWMDETEMALLAASDTSIAICTESNLKLASGIAPLSRYQKQGVRCCFGTDGVASNNNLDLLTELDFTAKLHKAVNNDPTMLPAEQMLRMATIEAARALHRDTDLGSLEVGKKADLVVLDCCSIEAQPMYNPYSQVIYALGSKAVRDVLINGEFVLKDRQLTRLDEAEIISTAKHYQQIIMEELKR